MHMRTIVHKLQINVCVFLPLHVWLQIMSDTAKNPKVLDVCHSPNRLQDLEMLSSGLEKCQKSLNDYLDSKRNAFPRFFFISDDELLSILGSHECTCVQEHMIKVRGQRGAVLALSCIREHLLCYSWPSDQQFEYLQSDPPLLHLCSNWPIHCVGGGANGTLDASPTFLSI